MVELGCGSAQKTSILLNALAARDGAAVVRFAGVDCSGAALAWAKGALLGSCPGLSPENIELVCAEYSEGRPPSTTPPLSPHTHTHTHPRTHTYHRPSPWACFQYEKA